MKSTFDCQVISFGKGEIRDFSIPQTMDESLSIRAT